MTVTPLATSPFHVPRVIAHRGACASAPENTLAAFRRAHELGARWVEFDVKLTADGRPVVFHDNTLDRTTDGSGPMADTPLAALGDLDAGKWFDPDFAGELVPTLEEVLDLLVEMDLGANMELKPCPGREAETAAVALDVARGLWPTEAPPLLMSSFSRVALDTARQIAPQWPRGLLVEALTDDWRAAAQEVEAWSIHCAQDPLGPAAVAEMLDAGYRVMVYTVNDPGRALNMWDWGVHAIFTDRPEVLLPLAGT
ncbi:glycerophosphodiester phosphodiesterase [Roseospira marina]|uniref:Glycerophosphodiester phosphodiesterase n=1 Tax=Roseospira marina TaxID=140057 RepID=A0A5M6IAY8_9PROT|nr:glycerophosphodiester phosphodiesterase [Roseospira marina]KAA5605393.1 glycerophosphodiester phosphodiesterase [Roseospira marina]MBB4314620.1 glycerophosphoryl diester phosphodiesterase [Roseospira marina]MBB5088775.1 glycerophosphoryl diester phosphodiesterase [Roseospira marina]